MVHSAHRDFQSRSDYLFLMVAGAAGVGERGNQNILVAKQLPIIGHTATPDGMGPVQGHTTWVTQDHQ